MVQCDINKANNTEQKKKNWKAIVLIKQLFHPFCCGCCWFFLSSSLSNMIILCQLTISTFRFSFPCSMFVLVSLKWKIKFYSILLQVSTWSAFGVKNDNEIENSLRTLAQKHTNKNENLWGFKCQQIVEQLNFIRMCVRVYSYEKSYQMKTKTIIIFCLEEKNRFGFFLLSKLET